MDEPISRDTDAGNKAAEGRNEAEQPDEGRLFQAVQSYLHELEQGRRPSRREWLAVPRTGSRAARLPGRIGIDPRCGGIHQLPAVRCGGCSCRCAGRHADWRFSYHSGDRPWRDGDHLRGDTALTGPPRGPEGAALCGWSGQQVLAAISAGISGRMQLHHNNIVPVFGVGCDRGVHFYAMQLIDGVSLDRVIRLLRREDESRFRGRRRRTHRPHRFGATSRRTRTPTTSPLDRSRRRPSPIDVTPWSRRWRV